MTKLELTKYVAVLKAELVAARAEIAVLRAKCDAPAATDRVAMSPARRSAAARELHALYPLRKSFSATEVNHQACLTA